MGRDSYSYRRIIEDVAGVRIQDLKNYGLLNKGALNANWKYKINQGVFRAPIEVSVYIQLLNTEHESAANYIHFDYEYKGNKISLRHPIEIQPVNLGGYRYFFKCDCIKGGHYCGRRVKALYFAGNVWGCRHCLELVYNNCRHHRNEGIRLRNNADTLHHRADILRRHGHPRKANILDLKALQYEIDADHAFMNRMTRYLNMVNKI